MNYIQNLSLLFLVLFAVVAAVDGIYFHLWKYRLFLRAESLYEHKLHTIRAFLFIPIIFLLFFGNFGGVMLWAAVFVILVDLVVEMLDVFDEGKSRAGLGGLSSAEYAAHVLATTFRIAFIAFALAVKPLSAWSLDSALVLEGDNQFARMVALNVIFGNLLLGALHLLLMSRKFRNLQIFSCCNLNHSR